MNWVRFFGLDDPGGTAYLFWSGLGTIIVPPLIGSLPIAFILLRKHNCHDHGCHRIGRYPAGDGWHYCRKHHEHDGKQHPE